MSSEKGRFLTEPEVIGLLAQRQVPYPEHVLAPSAEEAVVAAKRLGFPVVLKIVSPDVVHKSDLGGVVVNLADGPAVARAFQRIIDEVRAGVGEPAIEGVLVCRQAPAGVEVIVGATRDPVFGPTVMCGLGGVFTEILKDVSFRVAPLDPIDAEEMIQELQGYPILKGARGGPPADLESLARLIRDVSTLVHQRSDILELDLNPVRLYRNGLLVLDARMRIEDKATD